MRTILLMAALAGCDGKDTDMSSPAERRKAATDEEMGALWHTTFSTNGERDEVLVVNPLSGCDRATLDKMYRDGVSNYLRSYDFRAFRCARGDAEIRAPWK